MRAVWPRLASLLAPLVASGCVADLDFYDTSTVTAGGDGGSVPGDLAYAIDAPHKAGEPVHLGGTSADRCAAALASSLMRQPLCTCGSLSVQGSISTKVADNGGLDLNAAPIASLGSNGVVSLGSTGYSVWGSLVAADQVTGATGLDGYVLGALSTNGAVTVANGMNTRLDVRDAWIGGNINGPLHIRGKLHVPFGTQVPAEYDDDPVFGPISIPPPCDCATDRVPIGPLVEARSRDNDNGRLGVGQCALGGPYVSLPAGEYFCDGDLVINNGTLVDVHGPAAVFIRGSIVHLRSNLLVNLDPGASLDVVFTGDFTSNAGFTNWIGDGKHPSRVRLWSAGKQITFASRPNVGATLYAPGAQLAVPSGLELWGAALVHDVSLNATSWLDVHFDRPLLRAGAEACGAPVVTPLQ